MAALLVASSAPSTSGWPCASTPASSCSTRSAACARPPQQARCPQRRQWRRWQQRNAGGGSCRAAASGSDKPEWYQALEETAHLDDDVARLLASAKNNPDAVRRRMQEGKTVGVWGGWMPAFHALVTCRCAQSRCSRTRAQHVAPALLGKLRHLREVLLQSRSSCMPITGHLHLHPHVQIDPHFPSPGCFACRRAGAAVLPHHGHQVWRGGGANRRQVCNFFVRHVVMLLSSCACFAVGLSLSREEAPTGVRCAALLPLQQWHC